VIDRVKENRLVLIDTGLPNNSDKILQFLNSIGYDEAKAVTILLTHPDMDHAGSLAELKEMIPNARVGIHVADAAALSGEKGPKQMKGVTGSMLKMLGGLMKLKPIKADLLLKDGEEVEGLTVVHTPGHTEGSSCFYDEGAKAIFVGDALRTEDNGNLQKPVFNADYEQAMKSINLIATLVFERLYPGHGAPIIEKGSDKLVSFIEGLK
jgi:glyoxylase-like metal-dependent hydrolase (beta-lactamase superfamily II)